MIRRGISAATLLAAFACIAAFAQSDLSTITGVVKDPSGSAVPGAKINVLNEATGVGRQTISAESGTFP
jgi:Carboxypeptidase regulatory-like domain